MATTSIITRDQVKIIIGALQELGGKQVLIGIPESNAERESENTPITNAALAYIHEFGSPARNIPARPFLIPGVRKALPQALPHLRAAADAALDGEREKSDRAMVRAGIVGQNSAKHEISTGAFVPLKPATIANRYRVRGTSSMRAGEKRYMELVGSGVSPELAQAATGIHPLVNTGALRNAITFVVRKVR
jgi:hypothetical protein